MKTTRFIRCIWVSLLVGSLGPTVVHAAGHPHSGIIGQVFIGPTCPSIPPGFDCPDAPFQTSISFYSSRGKLVTRVTTDAEGHFAVTLKPGVYVLVPDGAESLYPPYVTALEVIVQKKEFTPVIITYDSGLR